MLEIILSILIFVFDIYILFFFRRKKFLKKQCEKTEKIIPEFGHNIAIHADTGGGKTTTGAAFVLTLTKHDINKAKTWNEDIRISLKDFDFRKIEKQFDFYYPLVENEYETIDIIINNLDPIKLETYYSDFLTIEKKENMIIDYLNNYYILNYRGIETYSSGYLYNPISEKLSYLLDTSSMFLAKTYELKNYQGGFYTIRFGDEKSLDMGNEKSNNAELRNSGYRSFLALKRHEGKGTCYTVALSQSSADVQVQERRLYNVNLEIYDRDDSIADFKLLRKALNIFKSICYFPIAAALFIKAKIKRLEYDDVKDEFSKKCGKWRNFEYKINQFSKLLKRQGYIRIRCRAYYRADDVGKKDPSLYDRYVFYFPIWYCYGLVDTFEYAPVLKEFSKQNENALKDSISQFDYEKRIELFKKITIKEESK